MKIVLKGLEFSYEAEHMVRLFYKDAQLGSSRPAKEDFVYVRFGKKRAVYALRTAGCLHICFGSSAQSNTTKACTPLYKMLCKASGSTPPWGMLTGVRPVNRLRKFIQNLGEERAGQVFLQEDFVSEEKYRLAKQIVGVQAPILAAGQKNSFSLYISVPFCPSRCAYCSFVSRTIERDKNLVQPYLQVLEKEIAHTAELANRLALKLETIYIGGGTPTALPIASLEALLQSVARHFNTLGVKEYTVEAGRPDCTCFSKLKLLKNYGVSRISINPQTMRSDVLQAIGRKHSPQDILRCMNDARRAGHSNINMDIIAGLPLDTKEGFAKTVEEILQLAPENITLHSLTLKKASNIVIDKALQAGVLQQEMLRQAYENFYSFGYSPYYLYRQKNTLANLENTGWAKKGLECFYNIFIMEESQSILALGAGGASKLVNQQTGLIKRFFNYKYPAEYIAGYPELQRRKKEVEAFYA